VEVAQRVVFDDELHVPSLGFGNEGIERPPKPIS
jgi:hypothetical protein